MLYVICSVASAHISSADTGESVHGTEIDSYLLSPLMSILEDKSGMLTIDQVSSSENQRFTKNSDEIPNLGITESTYWLKIDLQYAMQSSSNDLGSTWYLEIGRALLSVAELYEPVKGGGYSVRSSDIRLPFSEREVKYVNSVFPITFPAGQYPTIYLKIKNLSAPLYLPVTLWKPEAFVQSVAVKKYLYGLFYGCLLTLVIYNVFIYFSVKDVSYLYYVGYMVGIGLYVLVQYGHGVLNAFLIYDLVGKDLTAELIWINYIFGILFMSSFLEIERLHPRIYYLLRIYMVYVVCNVLLSFFDQSMAKIHWVAGASVIALPFFLVVSFYCWKKGNENGKYFLYAWVPNIVSLIFSALVFNQILPFFVALDAFLLPLGVLTEASIFSFALANRIKLNRAELLSAEKNKARSLLGYQSIFNNSLEGLYQMKMDGSITSVNPSLARIFGYSLVSEVMREKREVALVMFGSARSGYNDLIQGRGVRNSFTIPISGEQLRFIEHNARVIFDAQGTATHIEGTLVEVTESHEKTRAITEREKERLSKEQALVDMKQKNDFLSMMSHHIRTPLTSIIGYGELLKDGEVEGETKIGCVDTVVHNSHALLKLINNILDYSKIDAGKFDVEQIPFPVLDVLTTIGDEFRVKAERSGLKFKVEYQYPFPESITGDPTRIAQVLRNLCENAIEYTEKGSVALCVKWDNVAAQLSLSVKDTGPGVSNQRQQTLFTLSSKTQKMNDGGAGLGLVISKRLAHLMGGDLTVESQLKGGSKFTLLVSNRASTDVVWIREPPASKSKRKRKRSIPKLTGTVLLAEDNVVNQKLIDRVLRQTGVTVVLANDGLEACSHCDESLPDLVLMDINMPNRGGVEATEYLKERGYTMPIYALTAETDRKEIDRILGAGCEDFLTKPLNTKKLFEILSKHLE